MEQLTFPTWWLDAKFCRMLLDEWREPSSVSRPTEDAAMRNIYYQARAQRSNARYKLSDFETLVFNLYKHCKSHMPHMRSSMERYQWVAGRIPELHSHADGKIIYSVFRVQAILEEVEQVIRDTEMYTAIESLSTNQALSALDNDDLKALLREMGQDIRDKQNRKAA